MARMAIIVWILECKNVCWVYEQPHSSLLFEHPKMRDLVKMRRVFRAFTWMGSFGARSPKGTHLWAPTPLVHRFSMPLPTDVTWATDLVKKEVTKDGKVRVTGDKALKKSQSYTPTFGYVTLGVWKEWRDWQISTMPDPSRHKTADASKWQGANLAEVFQYLSQV